MYCAGDVCSGVSCVPGLYTLPAEASRVLTLVIILVGIAWIVLIRRA